MEFTTRVKLTAAGFEVLTPQNHFMTEKICRNSDFGYVGMIVVRANDGVWYSRRDDKDTDNILKGIDVEIIQTWKWDHVGDGYEWVKTTWQFCDPRGYGWREIPNPEATKTSGTDIEIDETYIDLTKTEVKMVPMGAVKTLTVKKSWISRLFNR